MYNNNWKPLGTDHAVRYATWRHDGAVLAEVHRYAVEGDGADYHETWTSTLVDETFHNMYHAQAATEAVLAASDPVKLAVEAGVRDESYDTVANGYVRRYRGEATITIGGKRYRAVGFGPEGTAEFIRRNGGIRFTPVDGGTSFVRG